MANDRLRILAPLDGSPESESIFPALLALFRSAPVQVTLLRVVPRDGTGAPVESYLSGWRKQLLLEGVPTESRLEWGRPVDEILHYSKDLWCDLVAMSTHGRTGLRRVFLGSVTEQVVRRSTVPVLVHRTWGRVGDWSRIVVALDGSERAEAVVPDATRLAKLRSSTVHVLSVGPAARYVEKVCDRLAREGVLAVAQVREGDPAAEITRFAEEVGAGLILMTTHGRTGLARALVGSVAEEVFRSAPCPVFVRRTVAAEAVRASA